MSERTPIARVLYALGIAFALAVLLLMASSSDADAQAPSFACAADAGDLTWTDDAQSRYWVYKSTDGGVSFTWLGRTLGATQFSDPAPTVGAQYQVHYDGISRTACTITAEPSANGTPFACDSNGGVLTWSDRAAPRYWIYKSTDGGVTYNWIGRTLGATTFTDQSPTVGAKYQVHFVGVPRFACTIVSEPAAQSPFGGAAPVPGVIEAEEYDQGGPGVAYADDEALNKGGALRSDGVDIWPTFGAAGHTVGSTRTGEWTEYTIDVASSGRYDATMRVASGDPSPGGVVVTIDGQTVGSVAAITGTGWWSFADIAIGTINLQAGEHILRVEWINGGAVNFDRIALAPEVIIPTPTPTPTATPAPAGVFTLHSGTGYTGASQEFTTGARAGAGGLAAVGNNAASSLEVEPGYIALVCTNGDGTGSCRGFTNPKTDLGAFGLDNNVSYVQVRTIGDEFTVAPQNDLDQFVNSLPAGTRFLLTSGVHVGRTVFAKDNMEFRGERGANGERLAIVDGTGADTAAFSGRGANVEIRGLEIRNYGNGLGMNLGAISARVLDDFSNEGRNWIVEDNYIHGNAAAGINVGSGMRIIGNEIADNRQIGISGLGNSSEPVRDVLIERNQIHDNGEFNSVYAWRWHEGGIKLTYARGLTVRGNTVNDNHMMGIYCDLYCDDVLIEDNRIRTADHWRFPGGIFYEKSYNGVIRKNTVTGLFNSRADVQFPLNVNESENVLVDDNTVYAGSQQGDLPGDDRVSHGLSWRNCCGITSRNVRFINNTIHARQGEVVIGQRDEAEVIGLEYSGNDYIQAGGSFKFVQQGLPYRWSSWQSGLEHDQNGSLS